MTNCGIQKAEIHMIKQEFKHYKKKTNIETEN